MIQHSANIWGSMNRTTLHQRRTELIDHMEEVSRSGSLKETGEGRGIVMVAGNADTLQRAIWSLKMLRSYNSSLPVQIVSASRDSAYVMAFVDCCPQWCFPSEMPGPDEGVHAELAELGAKIVAAKGYEKDAGKSKSYHLKAIAVVQCPWQEVLYLVSVSIDLNAVMGPLTPHQDSDSIPVRDPEYMFDAPNYKRLGIWATPDYWKTSANNPIWAILGVKCRNEWEMETGQMFIDKKAHLDTFLLIQYMLEHHDFVRTFLIPITIIGAEYGIVVLVL